MIASAYLRIFQPLDAIPERERVTWERYIVQGEHARPVKPVYRQRRTGSEGRLGLLTWEEDRADVRLEGGRWFVCPWRTRLRVLASLLALRDTIPSEVADVLVPEAEARRAARELARIRRRDPAAVPTMLQSHWHVPVRWFALFSGEERRVLETAGGGAVIRYWAPVERARERARRAARILERGDLDEVAVLASELDAWLSCFDQRSAVELDYGGVAQLFSWGELEDDHSAEEVEGALDALDGGDVGRAVDLYHQVAGRWAETQLRESLN